MRQHHPPPTFRRRCLRESRAPLRELASLVHLRGELVRAQLALEQQQAMPFHVLGAIVLVRAHSRSAPQTERTIASAILLGERKVAQDLGHVAALDTRWPKLAAQKPGDLVPDLGILKAADHARGHVHVFADSIAMVGVPFDIGDRRVTDMAHVLSVDELLGVFLVVIHD